MAASKGLVLALVTALVFTAFAWEDPGIVTQSQASDDPFTEEQEYMDLRRERHAFLIAQQQGGALPAQSDPFTTILARDEAMNAGNVATAVSLYANDATYTVLFGPGQDPLVLTQMQAITDRLASFVARSVHFEATVLGIIGETARASTRWSADGLRADGVAYLELFEEFVFEGGKIVEHTISVLGPVPLED